jgi:hypothetical protein
MTLKMQLKWLIRVLEIVEPYRRTSNFEEMVFRTIWAMYNVSKALLGVALKVAETVRSISQVP